MIKNIYEKWEELENKKKELLKEIDLENSKLEYIIKTLNKEISDLKLSNRKKEIILDVLKN